MKTSLRCNKSATWISPTNGFRLCDGCCTFADKAAGMVPYAEAKVLRCDRRSGIKDESMPLVFANDPHWD